MNVKIATDWEGPWVLNDFAYEVSSKLYSPQFFEKLSSYDDYLAYEVKKPGYNPGDTLRLIAPFLVAKGVNSNYLKKVSKPVFLKKALTSSKALDFELIVVSTAYEQFLEVSCSLLGMNYKGTAFTPEKYEMDREEREFLLRVAELVPKMSFDELNRLFWREMKKLETSWEILNEVKVMGGERKKEVAEEFGANVCIGDSISDSKMLEFALERGIAVSFNGNKYAIENSNVAVISDSSTELALLIHVYAKRGMDGVKKLCEARECYYMISEENFDDVVRLSESMRRRVRGNAGKLG